MPIVHFRRCMLALACLAMNLVAAPLANAQQYDCPTSDGRSTEVFQRFTDVINREYQGTNARMDEEYAAVLLGHALARAALAVEGRPERRVAFDCIELGAEQTLILLEQRGGVTGLYQHMSEAAYGMRNDTVVWLLGQEPTGPLTELYVGATLPSPAAPPQVPQTPQASAYWPFDMRGLWVDAEGTQYDLRRQGDTYISNYGDVIGTTPTTYRFSPGDQNCTFSPLSYERGDMTHAATCNIQNRQGQSAGQVERFVRFEGDHSIHWEGGYAGSHWQRLR